MAFLRRCGRTARVVDDAHDGDEPKEEVRRDHDLQEAYEFRSHGGFDVGFCAQRDFILDAADSTSRGEEHGKPKTL